MKAIKGVQGSERISEILSSANVSLDYPTVTDKAVIQFANALSKNIIKTKFTGSKLVLQSQEGIEIKDEITGEFRELEYKVDKNGLMYAEVIVPSDYKNITKPGDFLLGPDLMGFRIPSTELHSAVPLKIAGYYDSQGTNVIIAPKELVPLHGSDFDVDSLFIIRRENYPNGHELQGEPIGYELIDGKYKMSDNFKSDDNKIMKAYYKNFILEEFLKVISKKETRTRMLSPISMERLKPFTKEVEDEKGSIDLSDVTNNYDVYKSNFDGVQLTGVFANFMKGLAYIVKTNSDNSSPLIKNEGLIINIDGQQYDKISEIELDENGKETGISVWKILDSLVNAAIDNVKEQILPAINANSVTGPALASLISLGVKPEIAIRIMQQPVIVELSKRRPFNSNIEARKMINDLVELLNKISEETISIDEILKDYTLSSKNLNTTRKDNYNDLESYSKEELINQILVLSEFIKSDRISESIEQIASVANLVKQFPVFHNKMEDLNDIFNSIFENTDEILEAEKPIIAKLKEGFPFDIINFFTQNEHLFYAYKSFIYTKKQIENSIFKHNEIVKDFIDNVLEVKLSDLTEQGNANEVREGVKNEIMKYIISGIPRVQDAAQKGNEKPYSLMDGKFSVGGTEAWSYNFIDELQSKYLNNQEYSDNQFLKYISIENSRYGKKYIKYTAGTNLEIDDIVELQDDFSRLPDDLQQDLMTYSVINQGLTFGLSNYSSYISDNIIESTSKEIDLAIKELSNNPVKLKRLKDHFGIHYVLNNSDSLPYIGKAIKGLISKNEKGFYRGKDENFHYDLKFELPEESDMPISKFPKYIKQQTDKGNIVYKRYNDDTNAGVVYYHKVGFGRFKSFYHLNHEYLFENAKYEIEQYFRNELSIRLKSLNEPSFRGKVDSYTVGETFIGYVDDHRTNRKQFKITGVTPTAFDATVVEYIIKETGEEIKEVKPKEVLERSYVESMTEAHESKLVTDDLKKLDKQGLITVIEEKGSPLAQAIVLNYAHLLSDTLTVNVESKKGVKHMGKYSPKRKNIIINSATATQSELDHVLTHEILHDFLVYSLSEYKKGNPNNRLSEQQIEIIKNIEALYKEFKLAAVRDNATHFYAYSSNSIDEFINELMTNPQLQAYLNTIKSKREGENILNKLFKLIAKLLGINEGSILHYAVNDVLNLLDTLEEDKLIDVEIDDKSLEVQTSAGQAFTTKLKKDKELSDAILKELLKTSETINVDVEKTKEGEKELNTYNSGKYNRVTSGVKSFLAKFVRDLSDKGISEKEADRLWGDNIPKDKKLNTKYGLVDYDTYVKEHSKILVYGRNKGKIIHLTLQKMMTNDPKEVQRLNDEIVKYSMGIGFTTSQFKWVEDLAPKLFAQAGIDISVRKNNKNQKVIKSNDLLNAEVKIKSDLLGYAGAVDNLVQHKDGSFSIIDWKTGQSFDAENFTHLMKYGDQLDDIVDNPRNRAKLQIMAYAFMMKLENPDMQFKNLMAIWVPNAYQATKIDNKRKVEVDSYLKMIEDYLKQEKPDKYKEIMRDNPSAFDSTSYNHIPSELTEELKEKSADVLLANKKQELKTLINRTAFSTHVAGELKDKIADLTKEIIELEKDPTVNLTESEDMDFFTRWIGNFYDVNNPYLKTYNKILTEAKYKAETKYQKKKKKFDRLMLPVLNNYLRANGKGTINTISRDKLNFINYFVGDGSGLYDFAYTVREKDDLKYFEMVTRNDAELWKALDPEQRALLDFIQNEFYEFFDKKNKGLMHQIATVDVNGKRYTNMELVNRNRAKPFEYSRGFLPRIPKTEEEIRQDYGLFSKARWKYYFNKNLTRWIEDTYEQWGNDTEALPIKYLGSDRIISEADHSFNLELVFDKFMRNMHMKEELDSVHAIGRGLQHYFKFKVKKEHKNTVGFLEDKILLDVLDRKNYHKFFRKKIRVGNISIDVGKLFAGLASIVSAPIMWLQPINGTRNMIFISMVNARKAISDSVSTKLVGISEDVIDFTVKDLAAAHVEWTNMQKDAILGNLKHNKMWLLARKLKYLPDNYDWATSEKELLTQRRDLKSALTGSKTMYMFHTIPEEWQAMIIMAAQLKKMKFKDKSLWSHYDVVTKEGISTVEWTGGVRGVVKDLSGNVEKTITELDSREAQKLKRVYQQMHGGYRREERIALEAYPLGQLVLQFKKYLPAILMNGLRSKSLDDTIGYYRFTGDKLNGEDVMEWVAKVNEGRWIVIAKMFARMFGFKGKNGDNYKFKNLDPESKKQVVDFFMTMISLIGLYTAYLMIFSDADDDDSFKKLAFVIMSNYSQQYNFYDIAKNFTTAPAGFTKSFKMFEALGTFSFNSMLYIADTDVFGDPLTNKGNIKGYTELKRSIPYMSSVYSIERFLERDSYELFRTR